MMRSSSADGEVLERDAPHEVDVAVGPDREARAVHRVVATQQELIELEVVRRRKRQEVHLVAQRALVEIEVDRGRVTSVAREPHVPPAQLGVVLDDLNVRLVGDRPFEVRGDESVRVFETLRLGVHAQVHCTSRARRGRRSDGAAAPQRCSTGSRVERVRRRARSSARLRRAGCARSVPRKSAGSRPSTRYPVCAVVDERRGARRRSRRPLACRTQQLPARRGRTTPCGTGRCTRRRRGSRSRALRGAVGRRSGRGASRPRSATRRCARASSAAPSRTARAADDEQGRARSCSRRSSASHREVDAFERLDPSDEEQDGIARRGASARRASAWSPGEKREASTPGGTMTTRSGSAP